MPRGPALAVLSTLATLAALATSGCAYSGPQAEFCAGFADGYKALRGGGVVLPACPAMPVLPAGASPLREGLKQGMQAAGGR